MRRVLDFFKPKDPVAERLRWLKANGRIVEGMITELKRSDGHSITPTVQSAQAEHPLLATYQYSISNVTYEAAHELTPAQMQQIENYFPGAVISVRYDPRIPASSIID